MDSRHCFLDLCNYCQCVDLDSFNSVFSLKNSGMSSVLDLHSETFVCIRFSQNTNIKRQSVNRKKKRVHITVAAWSRTFCFWSACITILRIHRWTVKQSSLNPDVAWFGFSHHRAFQMCLSRALWVKSLLISSSWCQRTKRIFYRQNEWDLLCPKVRLQIARQIMVTRSYNALGCQHNASGVCSLTPRRTPEKRFALCGGLPFSDLWRFSGSSKDQLIRNLKDCCAFIFGPRRDNWGHSGVCVKKTVNPKNLFPFREDQILILCQIKSGIRPIAAWQPIDYHSPRPQSTNSSTSNILQVIASGINSY